MHIGDICRKLLLQEAFASRQRWQSEFETSGRLTGVRNVIHKLELETSGRLQGVLIDVMNDRVSNKTQLALRFYSQLFLEIKFLAAKQFFWSRGTCLVEFACATRTCPLPVPHERIPYLYRKAYRTSWCIGGDKACMVPLRHKYVPPMRP